jgi:hypothetical protein
VIVNEEVRAERPQEGGLRDQPARGRHAGSTTTASRGRPHDQLTKETLAASPRDARERAARTSSRSASCTSLYNRPRRDDRLDRAKFGKKPDGRRRQPRGLKAGYNYAETTEAFQRPTVKPAKLPAGTYRNITGNTALAWAASRPAKLGQAAAHARQLPDHAGQRHPPRAVAHKHFGVRPSRPRTRSPRIGAAIGAAYAGTSA